MYVCQCKIAIADWITKAACLSYAHLEADSRYKLFTEYTPFNEDPNSDVRSHPIIRVSFNKESGIGGNA